MFWSPDGDASCPVVGNVFGGTLFFCRTLMTAFALSSLGVTTALMFEWAVNCCSNVVAAVGGSHVPAGSPTLVYVPSLKLGSNTLLYPCANSNALLSVGSPSMIRILGFLTFHAEMQSTSPCPISLPTWTLSK